MKKILTILIVVASHLLWGQSTNWLQSYGSPNADEQLGAASDNNGNIITVGYFTNTVTFPNLTTITPTSAGVSDALVVKTDAQGQVVWKLKGGGMAGDRATAVACDASGNAYVTGFYFGSANFGSITLNSVNNTKDIFIGKVNSSGSWVWVKSAGGPLAEEPTSIAVDNQGNVIVTGEFQGAATFGTQTITSMLNSGGNSSFDVFTTKYDNVGNFVWVKQGAAKLDDRGLDVATDANGNVFVCGQFSDTITFNQTHNNTISNAIFLIKYSAAGQEQWFVRAGANSSISNALTVDNNNDVYVTGDFTGNLVFYGTPNNIISGTYANKIFLAKYSNAGSYLWGAEDGSSSYVSSKDVAFNPSGDPCLYGEFGCKMDEYSIAAGGTGMFNSIGFKDLFICQYDKTGSRQWMRNWGGPYDDKAHGITFSSNSIPYVAGSYEYRMEVDCSQPNFSVLSSISGSGAGWISSTNCNNQSGYYHSSINAGASDCFLLHGLDNTSPYYDYYYRTGGCQLDFVGGCIDNYTYNCKDTIAMCAGGLIANPYTGSIGSVGPMYHYHWNTGDTTSNHSVTSSGNYSCVMTTFDGCFTTQDTVYALLYPKPQPPTITDNLGINVNQPPLTYSIHICGGTVTLTGGNIQGCTYSWAGPGIVSTSGPSCVVNQTGNYVFTITNSYGCSATNQVFVKIDTIDHVQPFTNEPDSFQTCGCFDYLVFDSLTNPGESNPYNCFASLSSVITGNSQVMGFPFCVQSNLKLHICPTATGWINMHVKYVFQSLCGIDTAYFNKNIYVTLLPTAPTPTVTVQISGNTNVCPGDSTFLAATYTVLPSTATYTAGAVTSGWAHPGQQFCYSVNVTDNSTPCPSSAIGSSCVYVQVKPNPYITAIPSTAIICPNDSVKLTCQWIGAVSWQWYGPSGLLPVNAATMYTTVAGYYYCIATDNNGCSLTSNSIEVKIYNTPSLTALPNPVICSGQSVTLQVISNDTTQIQWLPPLSGNGTTKTVTTAGTYSCQVKSCGITTICSITVLASNPVAQITATGNLTICPGDSVLLAANQGMTTYLWLPTGESNDSIYAYMSGNYFLIVLDSNGCQASDSIGINYNPQAPPSPSAINDSICVGSQATLSASSTGNFVFQWYVQPYSGSVIATGPSYTTPPLFQDTTYYVSVMDSTGCHSIRTTAQVFIIPASLPPTINGDTLVCRGDTIHLFSASVSGAAYNWSGPNGFSSGLLNPVVVPAVAASAGTYSLFVTGQGCTSPVVTHSVQVIALALPSINGNDTLCEGASVQLNAASSDPGVNYSWYGPAGFTSSSQNVTIAPATVNNTGYYYVQSLYWQCISDRDSFYILVKPTPAPNAWVSTHGCVGDSATLHALTLAGASSVWSGPAGYASTSQDNVLFGIDSSVAGYYHYVSCLAGCCGKDSAKLIVHPLPYFNLGNDTLVCDVDSWPVIAPLSGTYSWNGQPGGSTYTVNSTGEVTLVITNQYGCRYSDSLHVEVAHCDIAIPNIFTPNGDGINDVFYFGLDHYLELKFIIYDRWGVKVFENNNNENSWNGMNIYTNKPVTDGTYYYIVLSKNMKGFEKSDHGYITVLR